MTKILIIEDEKPLRDAFSFLLTSEGFEVAQAENGKLGLSKLKDFKPQLVMVDMLMPIMNGLEFLRAARLPATYPGVQVLMLSNLSDPLTIENAQTYGVSRSVLKADLSPVELVEVVKDMLKQKQTRRKK